MRRVTGFGAAFLLSFSMLCNTVGFAGTIEEKIIWHDNLNGITGVEKFSDGMAMIYPRMEGVYGYINEAGDGNPPSFDSATNFENGFAVVLDFFDNNNGTLSIIDTTGAKKLKTQYYAYEGGITEGSLSEGLCAVATQAPNAKDSSPIAFMDMTGKLVTKAKFAAVENKANLYCFKNGESLAYLYGSKEAVWINKNGDVIRKATEKDLLEYEAKREKYKKDLGYGYFRLQTAAGKNGIQNSKGEAIFLFANKNFDVQSITRDGSVWVTDSTDLDKCKVGVIPKMLTVPKEAAKIK